MQNSINTNTNGQSIQTADFPTSSIMTTRYTDDEWETIIDEAEGNLPKTPVEYKAPTVGSEEFAKTIDHTILKLDATKEQVDAICEEARRFNFKVHRLHHSRILQTCSLWLLLPMNLVAQPWVLNYTRTHGLGVLIAS